MANRAVFLDRDGVLNFAPVVDGKPNSPKTLEEVIILNDVQKAITSFRKLEFIPVVVTNQPDVSRGTLSVEKVTEINHFIGKEVGIDLFYMCVHDNHDHCRCRKPAPGLLIQAQKDLNLSLEMSILVGDRWSDIKASQLAGCSSYFIDNSYTERSPDQPYTRVKSLLEVIGHLK